MLNKKTWRKALAAFALGVLLAVPGGAHAESFTLTAAVERALEQNFTIVSAQATREAAEAGRKSARGAFGPVLGTTYAYEHRQHKPVSATIVQDNDLFTWTVYLRQNVFAGFATLASYQKAALQKENAEAGYSKARLDLVRTVQVNFFEYLKAQENTRSAEASLTRLRSQLKVTQSFHDVGLKPRLEVLQAEVDVSEAEAVLLRAEHALSTQRSRLNTLLNLPTDARTEYVGSLDFVPVPFKREDALELAYQNRPDVIMASKVAAISEKDKTIAQSGFYPQINADLTWATQGNKMDASGFDYMRNSNLPAQHYSAWSIGLVGQWNVFEWGRTYYSVQQADKLVNKSRADEANLRVEVAYEVQARFLELDVAAKRIKVARKALEQATEAYRMAAARYESQVGTSTDVLDAQSKLTLAEVSLTGAQADYLTAVAAIYNAVGQENVSLGIGGKSGK